jgi:hypothetical protein
MQRESINEAIELGTDLEFRYLIDVKKQYTVYSLSGEPIPHLLCVVGTPPDSPASGILPTGRAPKSGTADEPHETFQGRNAVDR